MRFERTVRLHFVALCMAIAAAVASTPASAGKERPKVHVVAKGQTLGAIARRYRVTIEALCNANKMRRNARIKPGQRLVVPDPDDKDGSRAKREREDPKAEPEERQPSGEAWTQGRQMLPVPGAPPAYYYEPLGRGRLGMRPVIVYLHGRGGSPEQDCMRWAPVARPFGWLMCPSGPEDRSGGRGWANNWAAGRGVVMAALQGLREKYGRRVQLYGNTLIGFSEGAFVAMNIGPREARTFNRWLILAADDDYWGAAGPDLLARARSRMRRVYLITGKQDGVHQGTERVRAMVRRAGIPVQMSMPADMGHTVALESKRAMYRAALTWLNGQ